MSCVMGDACCSALGMCWAMGRGGRCQFTMAARRSISRLCQRPWPRRCPMLWAQPMP